MVPQPDPSGSHRTGSLCTAEEICDSLSCSSPVTPAPPTLVLSISALSCSWCCRRDTFLPPGGRERLYGPCGNVPAKGVLPVPCHTLGDREKHPAPHCPALQKDTQYGPSPSHIPVKNEHWRPLSPLCHPGPDLPELTVRPKCSNGEVLLVLQRQCPLEGSVPTGTSSWWDVASGASRKRSRSVSTRSHQRECLTQCPVPHSLLS